MVKKWQNGALLTILENLKTKNKLKPENVEGT